MQLLFYMLLLKLKCLVVLSCKVSVVTVKDVEKFIQTVRTLGNERRALLKQGYNCVNKWKQKCSMLQAIKVTIMQTL